MEGAWGLGDLTELESRPWDLFSRVDCPMRRMSLNDEGLRSGPRAERPGLCGAPSPHSRLPATCLGPPAKQGVSKRCQREGILSRLWGAERTKGRRQEQGVNPPGHTGQCHEGQQTQEAPLPTLPCPSPPVPQPSTTTTTQLGTNRQGALVGRPTAPALWPH